MGQKEEQELWGMFSLLEWGSGYLFLLCEMDPVCLLVAEMEMLSFS